MYHIPQGISDDAAVMLSDILPTGFDIGDPVELQLQDLWIKNITITTGLVSTNTLPLLLKTVGSGKIKPEELITHKFTFDDIMKAYDTFANASEEKALKIIIDF